MSGKVWNEIDCEVVHEEIIARVRVNRKVNGWRGSARIVVNVKINGNDYECNQVVMLRFKPQEP